ncbi:hypothetical protein [Natronolimnohabitans innermongolicus]|uniref:hypothetical protein n=1 Tax=Natronolimnohabitans innermongolicus TaxID=253107 RepID=UPI000677E845|nr:hypothetical protein [Natronolimnohabitans innermongolicus]
MGQRHTQMSEETTTGDLTVDDAVGRLEADDVAAVARAAFDHAGELAALQHGHAAAAIGAARLATRRDRRPTIERGAISTAFDDVDPDDVVAAETVLARHLGSPAPTAAIRSLRRRLIVAREFLAAVERGRVAAPELPDSYLADEAPFLLARAANGPVCRDDRESTLDATALRAHVERLEADLECARLGPRLAALVRAEE